MFSTEDLMNAKQDLSASSDQDDHQGNQRQPEENKLFAQKSKINNQNKKPNLSGRVVRHIQSRTFPDDDGVEEYYNFDNEVDNQIKIGTSEVSLVQ